MERGLVDVTAARAYLRAREKQRDKEHEAFRQRAREMARAAARSVLPAFPQVRKAYLFGSAVRPGAMRHDSDIDLAVEGHLGAEDYFVLWRELEHAIPGRTVELVELDADLHFAERVREEGEVIYPVSGSDVEKWDRGQEGDSMSAKIRTLKADIAADLQAVVEIYASLKRYPDTLASGDQLIAVAYYLHNLYCAFESIFQRVAKAFENQVADETGWHAELLRRMTLDIEGVRPGLVSPAAYDSLDELRRFRHFFRSAYRFQLDPERLALVRKKAIALEPVYPADMARFVSFLDSLLQDAESDTVG